jgi:hypothetical protein
MLNIIDLFGVCSLWMLAASGFSEICTESTFRVKVCRQHNLYDIFENICHVIVTLCILEAPCSLVIHLISNTFTGMQHIWEKSAYRILVGKIERKRTVRKSEVDGKIILK